MSFFQRGLSRAVGEKSDGALFVMSDGPGVDKVLQGFNDLTIGGHPVVGRLVVVDAQKPASLAKVPSADGEGAKYINVDFFQRRFFTHQDDVRWRRKKDREGSDEESWIKRMALP